MTGVGVYPSFSSMTISTPLPAKTSTAVYKAGSESACVSMPMNKGPLVLLALRYSQIAWLIARIWFSLKLLFSEDPLCPEVPKLTCCAASWGSGCWV